MRIYTKKGDDGTTGLFYGGRVWKDDLAPEAYGAVDEAVAVLATARAVADDGLASILLLLQRELFVVAAELATAPANRHKLEPGVSRVTEEMILRLETGIDEVIADIGQPTEFMVPGDNPLSAGLDHARAVVRRAERRCVTYARSGGLEDSEVVRYLNRLADYLYTLVRATESEWKPSRTE